ncbi:hypothetical protein GCM10010123_46340 [Pilimelia anulata]|uniref:Uncharacterized protein n=1 Tax=Pilimelia anulata TaxID=53371 RepID=A0A8J3BFT7_9ACTN|nr:hypothetical protein GCM10010123_46340 [Pilimelia anulata]
MFDAIAERNDQITACRDSRDEAKRAPVRGMRTVGPATMQRIRATLRVVLNTAIKRRLIDFNPASHVQLPSARSPKALVWTAERVKRWKDTGAVASPVMVWTPAQTGAFLDRAAAADDPLYHPVAHIGLRRGEACGLHRADLEAGHRAVADHPTRLGHPTPHTQDRQQ